MSDMLVAILLDRGRPAEAAAEHQPVDQGRECEAPVLTAAVGGEVR
jgi:hypothetical protein